MLFRGTPLLVPKDVEDPPSENLTSALETARASLVELSRATMPFGKYRGRLLMELPEAYLVWLKKRGFPRGKLGMLLSSALEIKSNGLSHLVTKVRDIDRT